MRSHGGGVACYKLHLRPACEECREVNARRHINTNRRPEARASTVRYRTTAKGELARVRWNAKMRLR